MSQDTPTTFLLFTRTSSGAWDCAGLYYAKSFQDRAALRYHARRGARIEPFY